MSPHIVKIFSDFIECLRVARGLFLQKITPHGHVRSFVTVPVRRTAKIRRPAARRPVSD
ncbi:hypothetical protein [Methylobacterium durans]|uniref:hypothetical protein n=1 Tax=Methylobacterium durans TaxID=2202825 RepID=UPI0013A5A3F8|nr:hypothetical protein [Methylobacterium durans]